MSGDFFFGLIVGFCLGAIALAAYVFIREAGGAPRG